MVGPGQPQLCACKSAGSVARTELSVGACLASHQQPPGVGGAGEDGRGEIQALRHGVAHYPPTHPSTQPPRRGTLGLLRCWGGMGGEAACQ